MLVLLGVLVAPAREAGPSPWGRVPDATAPPVQAWQFQPEEGGLRSALLADGVLVVTTTRGLVGLDPATGLQRWARDLDWPRCTSTGPSLVCVPRGSVVLDLDPATGLTVAETTVPDVQLAARHGGDLYTITDGRSPQLQKRQGGEPVWSIELAPPTPSVGHGHDLTVIAGHVLTDWSSVADQPTYAAAAAVDARTGTPVGSADDPVMVRRVAPGVWTATTAHTGFRYVRGQDEPQPIAPVARSVGYDADWQGTDRLRVGRDGRVAVKDTATGTWRWQGGGPDVALARLDGVLVGLLYESAPHLQAWDTTSGEVLWQRAETIAGCSCLADAHTLVLVTNPVTGGEHGFGVGLPRLTALDARTGSVVWQLEELLSTPDVLTDGEHLVLVTTSGITGWDLG